MSFELDRIEELCNDRGWSHYRLAKEMDISPNSIGNLFRRTTVPSIPTLRHICQVFGISMGEFYSTDGSQTILTSNRNMYLTFITSLVRLIRSGQNLIWKDWLTGLIGRKGIKKRKKKTADDFVGLSFSCVLLFVYGPLANTR